MLNHCSESSCRLWLGGLFGQDRLQHNKTKGRWQIGWGTWQVAWDQLRGQADLGQEHPPHLPQQTQRRLWSRLTSAVFGPGLKTSVDVLLPRDKHAGVCC